ncbi:MAG: ABC transporter permease [Armatimonadota bacterium]|nr:ABC transporter permease [Armatimonadota bacterium]MDR7485499.1 ABC transporter permease [Armatimonadota bacterium]MDR7533044.1 ABC transporter permease [Armatimonadota bacterium]MDR7536784.1 ABC transporter permease [Armatimonadota bacterium]
MWRSPPASWTARYGELAILGLVLAVVTVFLAAVTDGRLLTLDSLASMAVQMPLLGMLTLAQLLPMLTGGIDLSIISTANLAGIAAAYVLKQGAFWHATPVAVVLGLAAALAVGAVNGGIVAYLEVPPIITTLASMIFVKGFALAVTRGAVLAGFPEPFLFLGGGSLLGIPVPFLLFATGAAVLAVTLTRTPFGVVAYLLGSNPTATRFSGIDVAAMLFRTYLASGFLAGVAGLLLIARFNAAQADYGSSFLLLTVLIAVLGGVDPSGGAGTVTGLVVAVAILQVVATGFNLMGFSAHLANALWGVILVLVIMLRRLLPAAAGRA